MISPSRKNPVVVFPPKMYSLSPIATALWSVLHVIAGPDLSGGEGAKDHVFVSNT